MDYLFEGIGLDIICRDAPDRDTALQEYLEGHLRTYRKGSEDMRPVLITADAQTAIYNVFGYPTVVIGEEWVLPPTQRRKPGEVRKRSRRVSKPVYGRSPEERYLGTITVQPFVKEWRHPARSA